MTALSVADFEARMKEGATIIDTRIPDVFEHGFIPKALNFGLNGQYAIWAATLLDISKPVIIVADAGKEKESIERLTRVGFDAIQGYLNGGFDTWKNADKRWDMIISVDEDEFELDAKHTDIKILDVRKPGEFNDAHLTKAIHLSLDKITTEADNLNKDEEYLVHCAGGYRSMIAASYLKAKGFQRVKNVLGGWSKIQTMKLPISRDQRKVEAN
jgi:rhodanese-related sulfurtransferase